MQGFNSGSYEMGLEEGGVRQMMDAQMTFIEQLRKSQDSVEHEGVPGAIYDSQSALYLKFVGPKGIDSGIASMPKNFKQIITEAR